MLHSAGQLFELGHGDRIVWLVVGVELVNLGVNVTVFTDMSRRVGLSNR